MDARDNLFVDEWILPELPLLKRVNCLLPAVLSEFGSLVSNSISTHLTPVLMTYNWTNRAKQPWHNFCG